MAEQTCESCRFIVNASADDAPAVLAMMLEAREVFDLHPQRLGWGWFFRANAKSWFVAQIKGGLSARPARPRHTPQEDGNV